MLSGPEVFYHILALYMAVRSTFLLRQNGSFSSLQGGRMYMLGAAVSLSAGLAAALLQTPASAAVCLPARPAAAWAGWSGGLQGKHPFSYLNLLTLLF